MAAVTTAGVERTEPSGGQTPESVKTRWTKDPQQESPDQLYKGSSTTAHQWEALTQKLLNLTMEIIHLLTGEDYIFVKKNSIQCVNLSPKEENSPHALRNNKRILDLTHKLVELLTGEVPIRCQDVAVYFSMEEWEYVEGHKDLYQDMMKDLRPCTSPERPPHLRGSCSSYEDTDVEFFCQFEPVNGSRVRNEFHEAPRNLAKISDDRNVRGSTDGKQHPSVDITQGHMSHEGVTAFEFTKVLRREESCADEEEEATDTSCLPSDHTYYMTTSIKKEPLSCHEENLADYNCYRQQSPTRYIKEEPVLYNGENVTSPNIDTSFGHTHESTTYIMEEPGSYDGGNVTTPNIDTSLGHTHESTLYIMEEPGSYDGGNVTAPNIDAPSGHTHESTLYIKEEPGSYDGGNFTAPNINTSLGHTHQPTTPIKEEPCSYNGENMDIYRRTNNLCPNIKKDPISWSDGNLSDLYTLPSLTQQYLSTPVKEERVSCEVTEMEKATVFLKDDKKDIPDTTHSFIPRNTIQGLSTCNAETTAKPSLTLGHTKERPNSSSLVRSVVIAHLLEMAQRKQGNANNMCTDSQCQAGAASTSAIRGDVKETRLEHLKNGPGSTQRVYVKKRPTKTGETEKTFGDISNLTKYLRANSRKKTPQCSQCGLYFLRKSQLQAHSRIHAGQNPYECVDCRKYFMNDDQLVEHQKTHTGGFKCSVCRKCFDKESSLLKHQKLHNGEKPFQCPECGKCFSIYYELYVHRKTHTEDKKHQCSKCGKSYNSKVQFDVHVRTHTGERPYGCTGCGRRFMERKKLLTHQKLHAGLKPHGCPECGKRFSQISHLIVHRRIHTGRKPAVCFQCGKSFSTRSSLIRHAVTHSKGKQ